MRIDAPLITGSLNYNGTSLQDLSTYATTSSVNNLVQKTGSYALTGSNYFSGSQIISGSITATGNITAQTLIIQTITSSVLFTTGSNIIGSSLSNVQQLTGSVGITGSLAINGTTAVVGSGTANYVPKFTASNTIGNSLIYDDGTNVGIGTTILNLGLYSRALTILAPSGGSGYAGIEVYGSGSTNGGQIDFGSGTTRYAAISGEYESATNGYLNIRTLRAGTITNAVRITSAGSVGIGTSSPTTTLTVNGPITVLAGNNIYLTNTKLGGDASYNFDINYNTGGTPSLTWYGGTTTSKFAVNSTGAATYASSITAASPDNYSGDALKLTTKVSPASYYMNVYPTDAGAGGITWTFAQKVGANIYDVMSMRMGSLLIGRTDAGLTNTSGTTLAGSSIQVEGTGYVFYGNRTTTDGLFMGIRRNNVDVGSITVTTSATAFNTSSDYRLKTDFKDYNGLSLINAIKTYNYAWSIDNTRAYGVKAHELQELLPYMVFGEKDAINEDTTIKPQAVDYSKLVPILTKAIQELSAKIDLQQEEIEILKNK